MFTVTRNGNEVLFFHSIEEVESYILGILDENKDLEPKEIFRRYGRNALDGETTKDEIVSVFIYQYKTLYTEMFMIEKQ